MMASLESLEWNRRLRLGACTQQEEHMNDLEVLEESECKQDSSGFRTAIETPQPRILDIRINDSRLYRFSCTTTFKQSTNV